MSIDPSKPRPTAKSIKAVKVAPFPSSDTVGEAGRPKGVLKETAGVTPLTKKKPIAMTETSTVQSKASSPLVMPCSLQDLDKKPLFDVLDVDLNRAKDRARQQVSRLSKVKKESPGKESKRTESPEDAEARY